MSNACTPILVGVTSSVSEILLLFKFGQISLLSLSVPLSLSLSLSPSSSPSLELLKKLMLYYWLVLDSIGYYTLEDLQDLILMFKLFRFVHVHHVTNNRMLLLIELLLIIESFRLILVLKR